MGQPTDFPSAWRRWTAIGVLAALLAGTQALASWRADHALLINTSESLPNWALFIDRRKVPGRGDYVAFSPPQTPLVINHFGRDRTPFAKIAYGLPGDRVTREGDAVLVNGHRVGVLKPRTKRGEKLRPGPVGTIPRHCYYLGTPHKDGFDSRYADIGFVCTDRIVGTGVPIL